MALKGPEERAAMMNRWKMGALALLLGAVALSAVSRSAAGQQYGQGQSPQPQAGWDVPPPNMTQTQANGFRDGIVAGQDDIAHRIQPNATRRPEYRNPPQMPFLQRVMYRDGFQKGYQRVMDNFYGAPAQPAPPPMPVAPPPAPVYQPSGNVMEFRHRGFQDGMDGALRDLDNHRRPDPNNRDEFRSPRVAPDMVEPYRDGFRHGYDAGMRALTEGSDDWRRGPMGEIRMRGYREGAEGAIRDYDNHRRPDPNNRDEYRSPRLPANQLEPYRDGFRRGYARVASELQGYFGGR